MLQNSLIPNMVLDDNGYNMLQNCLNASLSVLCFKNFWGEGTQNIPYSIPPSLPGIWAHITLNHELPLHPSQTSFQV